MGTRSACLGLRAGCSVPTWRCSCAPPGRGTGACEGGCTCVCVCVCVCVLNNAGLPVCRTASGQPKYLLTHPSESQRPSDEYDQLNMFFFLATNIGVCYQLMIILVSNYYQYFLQQTTANRERPNAIEDLKLFFCPLQYVTTDPWFIPGARYLRGDFSKVRAQTAKTARGSLLERWLHCGRTLLDIRSGGAYDSSCEAKKI